MRPILVVFLWATLCAAKPPEIPCKRAILFLGTAYPLTTEQMEMILRGDNWSKDGGHMGKNAISYLAASEHLTGLQKARLWEQLTEMIRSMDAYVSVYHPIIDKTYAIYRSPTGHSLIINVRTGEMYRGVLPKPPEPTWKLEDYPDLRPLCGPSKTSH